MRHLHFGEVKGMREACGHCKADTCYMKIIWDVPSLTGRRDT